MKMRLLTTTIFSVLMLATVVHGQQTRICPYTGQPYTVPYPAQTTQYNMPPVFDQQKMIQQQQQRAQMQVQHQLQRDQMMTQQRIQVAQMEFNFRQPTTPQDQQMFQQEMQRLQQEQQTIQQRYNEEMRRVQQMR